MLNIHSNVTVHIHDASESGFEQNKSVTPSHSTRWRQNSVVHLKSETPLRVSRLGKAAIKGVYINMHHLLWLFVRLHT
jgi:GT2 family glycosyltransferase